MVHMSVVEFAVKLHVLFVNNALYFRQNLAPFPHSGPGVTRSVGVGEDYKQIMLYSALVQAIHIVHSIPALHPERGRSAISKTARKQPIAMCIKTMSVLATLLSLCSPESNKN